MHGNEGNALMPHVTVGKDEDAYISDVRTDSGEAVYIFRCLPSAVKSSQSGQVQ